MQRDPKSRGRGFCGLQMKFLNEQKRSEILATRVWLQDLKKMQTSHRYTPSG